MQNYPSCQELNSDITRIELVPLSHELTVSGLKIRVRNEKNIFLISQPKYILWVLKRSVSMRRCF